MLKKSDGGKMPSSLLQQCDSPPSFFLVTQCFFLCAGKRRIVRRENRGALQWPRQHVTHGKWQHPLSVHIVRLACDSFSCPSFLAPTVQPLNTFLYRPFHLLGTPSCGQLFRLFKDRGKESGCVRGGMMIRGGYKRSGLRT